MKKLFFIVATFLIGFTALSQTVIQMKREGGVSIIPCKVNGLKLSFIFDTGASDVTISLTEATFMLKNGYLSKNDILGTSNYTDANGDISEGININLREIEIQGLKLYNVKAAIVKNMDTPLLLGQTAISKLGVVQLDLNSNTLIIYSKSFPKNENTNSEFKFSIGQKYQGGVVCYIDETGKHGLIAANEDCKVNPKLNITEADDYFMWRIWSGGKKTGATSTQIGAGKSNTEKIIKVLGNGMYAAKACFNFKSNSFDDWFLPSKEELYQIYLNRDYIPNLNGNQYWSSSEDIEQGQWMLFFNTIASDGNWFNDASGSGANVRAIRYF